MAEDNCIFCKISSGQEPTSVLEMETDEFVIFKDIKPASQHHYLAVTKTHYTSLKVLDKSHDPLGKSSWIMLQLANKINQCSSICLKLNGWRAA